MEFSEVMDRVADCVVREERPIRKIVEKLRTDHALHEGDVKLVRGLVMIALGVCLERVGCRDIRTVTAGLIESFGAASRCESESEEP